MPRRNNAAALRDRLAAWLGATRRAEVDELVPGVVARTARLGDYLVVLEVGLHAQGLLLVANAASGAIAFLAERTPEEESSPIVTPEVMAAIGRDLDGVTATATVH